MSNDHATAARVATDRMETLQRLATHFPKLTPTELTAMADWVMAGGSAVDPAGLARATRTLAIERGEAFATSSTRGVATAMILAYLGH